MAISSNVPPAHAARLDAELTQVLQNLLNEVSWLGRWRVKAAGVQGYGWDLFASGPVRGGRALLCVECKNNNFQPSHFRNMAERPCRPTKTLVASKVLAMPRVSQRMATLCRQHDWSWFDLAGNCRLEVPGFLLIERSGIEPVKAQPRAGANLSTPEAARIIRALLAPENAGRRWTQRHLVAHFGQMTPQIPAPSLGLVNRVVRHLLEEAFLEPFPNRGFRVRDYEGLLKAWRDVYRFDRHRRRRYFTLLHGRAVHDRLRAVDPNGRSRLAYAVFTAADFQAPAVRQPRTWLYVRPEAEQDVCAALDAKPVDSGENVVVLMPQDEGVFYLMEAGKDRLACTNAVQTYVDLTHASGRGDEAAEALLEQRLKPAWIATTR